MDHWTFSKFSDKKLEKLLSLQHHEQDFQHCEDSKQTSNEKHFLSLFGNYIKSEKIDTNIKTPNEEVECIEISSSSESEKEPEQHEAMEIVADNDNAQIHDKPDKEIKDLTKYIIDTLEAYDGSLIEEDVRQLENLERRKLEDVFKYLGSGLSEQGMKSLCRSLCTYANSRNLMEILCSFALLPLLTESDDTKLIEAAITEIKDKYADIICSKIMEPLFAMKECTNSNVVSVIEKLSDKEQQDIYRNFISSVDEIQEWHIPVIQILYKPHIEKQKLIELMKSSSQKFSAHKLFGKLLLTVIQSTERQADYLGVLEYIIDLNKSIFKRAAKANLDKLYN